ncbi:MAG: DUF4011 domain-containing protein [Acidobacteriaceae bacterium]|nr:DUF4011 domain-containing protein [Acidobacteriaceae bacterium]
MSTDPSIRPSKHISAESRSVLCSALEQLRLKLLDLSGRNRLINFKHTSGRSMQFIEGNCIDVYQKLVEANNRVTIPIAGLQDPETVEWIDKNGRQQRPDPKEWATKQGISISYDLPEGDGHGRHSHLRVLLYPDDLAKHCRKIEREAVLAIEETGANMLFLVLGFLEFPDQRNSDKAFAAPLICIPVTFLKRETAGTRSYLLQYTGDDISENLSLREKLKNDFGMTLPYLDEEQIDVGAYFAQINRLIRSQPRFAFRNRISLCLLSFSNMLLVRDLDPTKWPQNGEHNDLIDHPIVREVFEGTASDTWDGTSSAEEHAVEEEPGVTIPLVFDADSSQHSALIDVLSLKKNLVIEGPPGTGKSQTITNLIAACLAEGKTVLFVAEKLAALEVVKNRLQMAGLDSFVLELHSNKTNKRRVLDEIAKRIDFTAAPPAELPRLQQQLETHRGDLKAYSELINSVIHNSFGKTLHQIMWRAEAYRVSCSGLDALLSQIVIPDAALISEYELSRRMDCLGYLSSQHKSIGGFDEASTFWGFFPEHLVPGDEVRLANLFQAALDWATRLHEDALSLYATVGGVLTGITSDSTATQVAILDKFLSSVPSDLPLHLVPGFFEEDKTGQSAHTALASFDNELKSYHTAAGLVQRAIKSESSATESRLNALMTLSRNASKLGVELGNISALRELERSLTDQINLLTAALSAITNFAEHRGIPFSGTRQDLITLKQLITLVIESPEEHLHLQTPGLGRERSAQAIESLMAKQNEWVNLRSKLNDHIYTDALPVIESINVAIRTLREGSAWYRVFQSRYRSAVSLHKSIQKNKRRTAANTRLQQLEQVRLLQEQIERWKCDPAWQLFLGFPAPSDPPALDGFLILAQWNHSVIAAMENSRVALFDPASLNAEQARALRRELIPIKHSLTAIASALDTIDGILTRLQETPDSHSISFILNKTQGLAAELDVQLEWLESEATNYAPLVEIIRGCEAALDRARLRTSIEKNTRVERLIGNLYAGVDSSPSSAIQALLIGQSITHLNLSDPIKQAMTSNHPVNTGLTIKLLLEKISTGLESDRIFASEMRRHGEFDQPACIGISLEKDLAEYTDRLINFLTHAVAGFELLIPWSLYVERRKEVRELGLSEFIALLEKKQLLPDQLVAAYAYCTYASIIRVAFRNTPQLGSFTGLKHNQIRDEFKRLDREIISLRGRAISSACVRKARPPYGGNGTRVNDKTEMVLLNYLLPQQRPRMPVRKMLMRAGKSFQSLKPCFMMGPQAVAQYLTPGAVTFDLVIMDEASQLRPEEAIGAIARGGQLVVVGDPKQLPPTSFFSHMSQVGDDDQFTTTDAESILDVCASHFRPTRSLRWHYRSQHHSLIAFSNHNFYRDNLIIFPSPYGQGGRLGVRAVYLSDAVYENQMNPREAKRVVDAVVEHISTRSEESLGVVTLNIKQRDLISELLEERLKYVANADSYRERWTSEGQPLFIKNLENVQGDERDAILVSTTFGKAHGSSVVRQNFGPISRQGGWRRLNVLFTRAKKSIALYTSMRPEDIVMDGTTPEGTKALRNYLEFARTGSLTTAEETGHEPDSDFEISVMDMLKQKGYEVTAQLGVAGFRIDLAVKHPDNPGAYLAAIECDGATYHSARSVRDRDRIRQEILEALGWRGRIWRIWSTDWFRSPHIESAKLLSFLQYLSATWKPEHASGEAWTIEGHETDAQAKQEDDAANDVLIDVRDYLQVEIGSTVKYADLRKLDNVLTVQITSEREDSSQGILHKSRPLAQALLGSTIGDEVTLHLVGVEPRTFRILGIERNCDN